MNMPLRGPSSLLRASSASATRTPARPPEREKSDPRSERLGRRAWACALGVAVAVVVGACASAAPPIATDGSAPEVDAPATDAGDAAGDAAAQAFVLTSPAFADGGTLPITYTCDGAGISPPLAWTGVPSQTSELALMMTTLSPDGLKWNWVVYGIPLSVSALAEDSASVGTFGLTSDGPNRAYYGPCSSGPGAKFYTFTLYALSSPPELPTASVTGAVLTSALAPLTLASVALTVSYTR